MCRSNETKKAVDSLNFHTIKIAPYTQVTYHICLYIFLKNLLQIETYFAKKQYISNNIANL